MENIKRENSQNYIIIISFLVSFAAIFVISGSSLAAPSIGKEYAMNNVTQNWILTMLLISISAFTIPAGQISSKYGNKKMFIIGCLLFLIGLVLSCISISSEMFLISRAIQGIGYAIYGVAEMAMLVLLTTPKNRGKTIGIAIVGSYLGSIIAPLAGGYLINNFGWRTIFYIGIPFVIFCILLTVMKINQEWKPNKNDKLDLNGCLLYIIGIILFVYGFSNLLSLFGQISIIIGVVFLIIFGVYESKIELPVFNIKLFKNRRFSSYNLSGFFCFFAFAVYDVFFNYYFQYVKGWDPQTTGLALIITPIIIAIISPFSGKLSDKTNPQKISTVGLVLILISIMSIIFLNINTPVYLIIISMIILAMGTGLFSVPNTNAILSSVSQENASYASATQITLRSCGQTLSLSILTLVCSMVMGNLPLSTEYAGLILNSANIISVICAVLCVVAILFAVLGIKSEPNRS